MESSHIIEKETLRDLPLFSELEIKELRQITAISSIQRFKKNDIIFLEGAEYRGFYIVLKGTVKVFKVSSEGKESILHLIKSPQAFADVPLFEGGDYPANAQALEDCALLFIPKRGFVELLQKSPTISLKMLAGFAKRLKLISKRFEDLSLKEVTNRLARYLVEELERSGTTKLPEPFVNLSISKATLAAYLGTITETLSRTFKKLQDENIIRVHGKTIFVENYVRLKYLAK
jgi:CRP/FNR family transcriptional regulator